MDVDLEERGSVHLRTGSEAIVRSVIYPAVSRGVNQDTLRVREVFLTIFKYINSCVLVTAIQTFQWIGLWNSLTNYIWPWPELEFWRDIAYVLVGLVLIFISNHFFSLDTIREEMLLDWSEGVPSSFSWLRKFRNFTKKTLNFVAFVVTWVGAWSIFDEYILPQSLPRDLCYIFIPILTGLVLEEFLSSESIYYLMAKLSFSDDVWMPPDIESQTSLLEDRHFSFNNRANSIKI
eukprot:TRINITY_DN24041_c0_g1_i1.p1 TRINITY_DN24041_c0_g1~~TRINITY_DN24041_c0_g1_i1.p1  ORF type:complete len:234 (+),score=13.70 TRINITY_DN24041_c0_g1_i1:66-767(+)